MIKKNTFLKRTLSAIFAGVLVTQAISVAPALAETAAMESDGSGTGKEVEDSGENAAGYLAGEKAKAVIAESDAPEAFPSVAAYDENADGIVDEEEAKKITKFIVDETNGNNVQEYLAYFTNLEELEVSGLTTLDLSKNTELKKLSCMDSRLTALDITKMRGWNIWIAGQKNCWH